MINIVRSETAPDCLKKQQDYKCGDVIEKLEKDFLGKCYICETDLFSINVEHFKAHGGDKTLKFEWSNLFFACGHCNNIKLSTDILDCTNKQHNIGQNIKFTPIYLPVSKVEIEAKKTDSLTLNTVKILNKVYNGHTDIKTKDAQKIKNFLIEEIINFQSLMLKHNKEKHNIVKIKEIENDIKSELHKGSKLTAFKRQIIKDNTSYKQFEQYFD